MSHEPTPAEEPWERDVAAALGRLPAVEPPTGFLERAVDHRPLHAGRVLAVLLALSLSGIGLSMRIGDTATGLASTARTATAGEADVRGEGDVSPGLRTAVPPLEASLADQAADAVLALARQIGFP